MLEGLEPDIRRGYGVVSVIWREVGRLPGDFRAACKKNCVDLRPKKRVLVDET